MPRRAMSSNDIRWDDLRVPLVGLNKGGVSEPDIVQVVDNGSGSTGVFASAFDATTEEELHFAAQLPHGWKIGTDLSLHVHWGPSDANAGNVVIGVEYTLAAITGTFPTSTIVTATDAASGTAADHLIVGISTIDMSSISTISAMILGRVFREAGNAADTYGSDAFIYEVDFHYQIDDRGSLLALSK